MLLTEQNSLQLVGYSLLSVKRVGGADFAIGWPWF